MGPADAPVCPTCLAALDHFCKLVVLDDKQGTDCYHVSALMNQYRAQLKATRTSAAHCVIVVMARGFTERFGGLTIRKLKPHQVEAWLARQDSRSPTFKAHAGTLILAAVSWAWGKGFIETDPLAGRVDLPQPNARPRRGGRRSPTTGRRTSTSAAPATVLAGAAARARGRCLTVHYLGQAVLLDQQLAERPAHPQLALGHLAVDELDGDGPVELLHHLPDGQLRLHGVTS